CFLKWGQYFAVSVAWGALLMGLNLLALIWAWDRIFIKKSIALATGVIVLKYAFLGVLVYLTVVQQWADVLGFIIGLSTVLPTVLALSLKKDFIFSSKS